MPVTLNGNVAQLDAAYNSTVLYCDWFVNSVGSLNTSDQTIVLSDFTIASESGYSQFTIPLNGWTASIVNDNGTNRAKASPLIDPTVQATANWATPITGALIHDGVNVWGWDYLRNPVTGSILTNGVLLSNGESIGADI